MHLIRPIWLKHGGEKKDFEVYSCHVSPDGTRLATAAGDGHVRVWSTDAIYNAAGPNYSKPKQLASMSHHTGTIHAVRFSPNGRFLASGADDKIVCIYLHDTTAPAHASTFGSDEPPPVENWRIFRRLIGHDNDVQDLGWAYDSSVLVSVGLDSKVVVWSGHTFEKLKTISSHQSHVKGLTFDPANKYFATASDDRTVKVFRFTSPGPNSTAHDQVNNFTLEKSITTPFAGSPLTTYFRRCSWSPDGNHIAAANAVNGPVSSVSIINRGNWDGDIHLIGHEGPVEVCAFSPRLFSKTPPSQDRDAQSHSPGFVTVIACAGQDKALSVWITSMPRPLVITQDLAVKSISDLAWSPDGRNLFVTSLDGSITSVMFSDGELGYAVSLDENEKALAKFGGGRKAIGMVEGPTGLMLEEKSKEGEIQDVEGRMSALMGDASSAPTMNGSSISTSGPGHSAVNGSNQPATLNGKKNVEGDAQTPPNSTDPSKDQQAAKLQALKKRVTITKDGKKRMAPLLVSTSNAGESSLPQTQLRSSAAASSQLPNSAPQTILDLSKPADGLPKGGLAALLLGNKRKLAVIEGDENDQTEKKIANASRDGALPVLSNTTDGLKPATVSKPAQLPAVPEFIRPAVVNPSLTVSQVRLAVPKLRTHITHKLGDLDSTTNIDTGPSEASTTGGQTSLTQADTIFEARNPTGMAPTGRYEDREPARLTLTRKGQPIWQDFVPKSVLLMTGGRHFWAAACEDGSLYVWSQAGIRLINAIVLESQPVFLESRNSWLLCVTAVGMCYVWDIKSLSSPHPPVSLAPILDIATHSLQSHTTKAPAVTSAHLNGEGRIVISLTNGDGYTYSPTLFAWQRLSEVWWAVGSQYWNTTDSSLGNVRRGGNQDDSRATDVSAGVLPYLEKRTTDEMITRGRAYALQRLVKQLLPREGYESFESSVSIAHLENRLAGALTLGAKQEFQVYLYMYARRLGAEGMKGKVEELLRTLLGGIYEGDTELPETVTVTSDRYWTTGTESICGWPRRELLRGVILILGKHRDLQRVTVPYAKLLGLTEGIAASEDMILA